MKQIPGFPNYLVTKDGRVWSKKRPRVRGGFLKMCIAPHGYMYVTLCRGGKRITKLIHRLVLETYVGPCPKNMETCHNNGIRIDNRLKNLRWDTRSNNQYDAVRHGTHTGLKRKGTQHPLSKLTESQVILIFNAYHDGVYTQKELADMFGINRNTVSDIIHKRTWRHLWDD